MGYDGLYDTLRLLGLRWLSTCLYWVWLRGRNGAHPPRPTPATSIQKRSKDPNPSLASSTSRSATRVSALSNLVRRLLPPRHPSSPAHGDVGAPSIPSSTSVLTRTAPTPAGWAGAISA
jgi:hypothetical protein